MNKKYKLILCVLGPLILVLAGGLLFQSCAPSKTSNATQKEKPMYHCPMHPTYVSDKPGDCPICNMKLVKIETEEVEEHAEHGMKEKMPEGTVMINTEKQQLIGVRWGTVETRHLTKDIRTVGRVAYDPELVITQEEFLRALETWNKSKDASLPEVANSSASLLKATERKLRLLGMNEEQIEELKTKGTPQMNLYLPSAGEGVWVYITVYEYELSLVKVGSLVEIESLANPGETFHGEVKAIDPVLNPMTRSVRVRAEVPESAGKLKPEMFVNVIIKVDLGEVLTVPEEAVLDTGTRQLVFVKHGEKHFEPRTIKVGHKSDSYYEVIEGLTQGEEVVTSGNFLIDSESKLKSAIGGLEHKHGQ
jgi:Cu(I)/Ag(I) efflux system membrane fusion protein